MRLHVGHQHWQFWPILARFMDYYSLFWCPGVITTINKPSDASTCRSPTLAVLADSGPFHGLLLTVLGPRVISMINKTWDAFTFRTSTLPVLADSCPLHGVLLIVLGSQSDYHDYKTLGCVYVLVINTHSFGRLWRISWTITHWFGVME